MTKHFLLYGHGGSYNHGCEALTRCTISLLRDKLPDSRITLSTHFAQQDREFRLNADDFVERDMNGSDNRGIYAPTIASITPDTICIHVAGDNYCYRNWQRYAQIHYEALRRGAKSILWSFSVDPEAIDTEMLDAFRSHHLICAREKITYNALIGLGLENVVKVSDIAFTLQPEPVTFDLENYIALNLSPLILRKSPHVKAAFQRLVDYIIDETDMNIALVPHVTNSVDNDCDAFRSLDNHGSSRIFTISDKLSAGQYKSIVSKSLFCVTARTHLAIAAYSSYIPTLAIGYNSKSSGIAQDLEMEEYVLSAESITSEPAIANAFCRLVDHRNLVDAKLRDLIPAYAENAVNDHAVRILTGEN